MTLIKLYHLKLSQHFLALILPLNNFVFNSRFYLQIKGCAMSTICSPEYEYIFMVEFEQKYISWIQINSFLTLYWCIFMVWTKSEKQLKDFINEMKLDYKFGCKQIELLDTLVYIDQQNKMQPTLFRKSRNH